MIPFAIAFLVRPKLETRYVDAAGLVRAVKAQFALDLGIALAVGVVVAIFNALAYGFPLSSALTLMLGVLIMGFFLSLDTALARERVLILESESATSPYAPPPRLYPMTRRFSVVAVVTTIFVTVLISLVILRDFDWLFDADQIPANLETAEQAVFTEIFFIMGTLLGLVVNLIFSYSRNLKLLFQNETRVLEKVSNGDLSRFVPVTTNDEFGFIAGHTNTMIRGLRHHSRLVSALKVAEEVQQNLLPHHPPAVDGIDLSGVSLYCDETGGDYFDYIDLPDGRMGIVVADAADHGIGSALNMATARAFMRFAAHHYTDPAGLMEAVNRDLTRDSAASGRFITAFFLEIDPAQRRLRWSRAGHEPALMWDLATARFNTLNSRGMALGVDANASFEGVEISNWPTGNIILIGTDGIHEARNSKGEYFGHERLKTLIRQHHERDADGLKQVILKAVEDFRGGFPMEDDLTLVTVKLN
ncbi:MAG: SpoIIE family protein phosphatase [Desulfosarcinaceae bacterium]